MAVIIGKILGYIALCVTIICYQFNSQKKILGCQIICATLFTLNLFLLGGMAGALLNIHGLARALVFYQRGQHKWARHPAWIWIFSILAVVCVAVTYKSPFDILALIGQIFTTISFSQSEPRKIRLFTLPSPPLWGIYHFSTGNYAGVMNEIFVLSSILIAIFRYDIKGKKENAQNAE